MNKLNSRTISINALAIALVCLSTMFLQFPIPLGYAHLGNCFILISGVFFGPVTGLTDRLRTVDHPNTDHQRHHGLCHRLYCQPHRPHCQHVQDSYSRC